MSYLLDKKAKQKKYFYGVFFVVILFFVFYFRSGIWNGLSFVSHTVFRPVLVVGNSIGGKLGSIGSYFSSKNALLLQNQNLQSKLNEAEARMSNYDSIVADDASIKEILARKDVKVNMTLSAILSKPNLSPYDTLIIDVGIKDGIKIGDIVFAIGNIPIGRISDVYQNSSKVILFSNSGEKTQAVVYIKPASPSLGEPVLPDTSSNKPVSTSPNPGKNIFVELIGRGGGNFEMIMPRDLVLSEVDQVVFP